MTIQLSKAANKVELDGKLVSFVVKQLERGIVENGQAILVVSGGSTPLNFFQHLSQQALNWSKVIITLADERCVAPTDELSNAKLVKDNLLQNLAQSARFIPLFIEGESINECADRLGETFFTRPFDVVILGMGGDGHTASIFPEAKERDQALDLNTSQPVLKTDPVTVAPERITFTRKALLNSRNLLLHFTGEAKWQVFEKAKTEAQVTYPISFFIHQEQLPLQVFFTD